MRLYEALHLGFYGDYNLSINHLTWYVLQCHQQMVTFMKYNESIRKTIHYFLPPLNYGLQTGEKRPVQVCSFIRFGSSFNKY